jgi:steroid 5-alpha reductase family enzyme
MAFALAFMILAIVLVAIMTAAWWIALKTGQSGWVDTIWSLAVGIVGLFAALAPIDSASWSAGPSGRQWLVAAFCGLWGARLGLHIGSRTKGGGDDPRYAQKKAEWGEDYARQFFLFLQVQALAAFVLDAASFVAAHAPGPLGLSDALGVALLAAGIIGEAVSDAQLQRFRQSPENRGKVCDIGLWSWSRHPNYFFEWLGWCAYPIITLAHFSGYQIGLVAIAAPIMMYWLLVHVSGIPPLEAHMWRSRGAAFEAYAARVNAFWPLPPKR